MAALGAAALATLADGAVAQSLRPTLAREALEVDAALQIAIERCEARFALDGVTGEVASRRATAFRQCPAEWMDGRAELQWRDDLAAAIRCVTAAAAYLRCEWRQHLRPDRGQLGRHPVVDSSRKRAPQ